MGSKPRFCVYKQVVQSRLLGAAVLLEKINFMQEAKLKYYLEKITEEDTFHALREAGTTILPKLEQQFQIENNPQRRQAIVRIVWECRQKSSIHFLAHALADHDEIVWKEALDGLVAISDKEVQAVLQAALLLANPIKQSWLKEALQQIVREEKNPH